MSNNYRRGMEQRRSQRRSRLGCLAGIVALVWLALGGVLIYRSYIAPRISSQLGTAIGSRIEGGLGAAPGEGQPQGDVQQGASGAAATAVAALPEGELRFTEAQINGYIAAQSESLKPIDSATVHLTPGEVQVDVRALGLSGAGRSGLAVQDGRIIAVNPRVEGVLGRLVSAEDLARTLEQQVNAQLAAEGRRVKDVRIEQGALVVTIER